MVSHRCIDGEPRATETQGPDRKIEYAGTVIADAVRLEAASSPGEILIDLPTWSKLPPALQAFYGPEEMVAGKRDEKYPARRYRVLYEVPVIPWRQRAPVMRGAGPSAKHVQILKYMEQLQPDDLAKLIFLIEMPPDLRPSPIATLAQRKETILGWVGIGCEVDHLLESLKILADIKYGSLSGK